MLLFCPNCGRRFEVAGHEEADAAHKCPFCGTEFGETKRKEPAAGKLKFVSGGETHYETSSRASGEASRVGASVRIDPAKCELGRELNRSGAGILFEGRDIETGELVLVRRLLVEGGSVADAERWSAAASKLQNLRHPRVIPVLGVGLRDDVPHVVTERASGRTLAEAVAGRPIAVRQAVQHALQVVEALTVAQGAMAVHGNLKPSNVIIDPQGRARVCDFGFAPRAFDAGEPVFSPHVLGWLPFAAPEVVREGPAIADERSDAYSVGALLYFMLTGKPPFASTDPRTLLASVLEETPAPPSSINPKVPADLDAVVMRILEKNPTFRPANVQAVGFEIKRFEREAVQAGPLRKTTFGRKKRAWPKALVALVLLGAAGGGGYWFYRKHMLEGALGRAQALVEEAKELERTSGGLPEAVERYRLAAEAASGTPSEVEYLLLFADALVRVGDPISSVDVIERASRLRSNKAGEARAWLPSALVLAGRHADAESVWRELAQQDGAQTVVRSCERALQVAERLMRQGRAQEVCKLLEVPLGSENILRLCGGELEGKLRISCGEALVKLERPEDARTYFARALSLGGTASRERSAVALAELTALQPSGWELSKEEEDAIASSSLARAIYARTVIHRSSSEANRERAGKTASEIALSADAPQAARAWAFLTAGELAEMNGMLEEAATNFRKASEVASGLASIEAMALVGAGRLALRSGDAKAASARSGEVLKRFGADPACAEATAYALLLEGCAQRLLGQPDSAARKYRELLGEFGGSGLRPYGVRSAIALALCSLAEVAMETRSSELAQSSFEKLRSEGHVGVLSVIARVMRGEATEEELLEVARRSPPDDASRALYCAALRSELAGDLARAEKLLNEAIEASKEISWYRFLARLRLERR